MNDPQGGEPDEHPRSLWVDPVANALPGQATRSDPPASCAPVGPRGCHTRLSRGWYGGQRPPYSPAVGPAGQGLGPDHATQPGVTSAGSSALAAVAARPVDRHSPAAATRGKRAAAWHTQLAAVVPGERVPVGLARKAVSHVG